MIPGPVEQTSIAVIGLGAIGGSLAWQARLAGIARVIGCAPRGADGVQALKADAITELADDPVRAARGADLVVLATPPRVTLELIGRLGAALKPTAILTDVCSVKAPILARAREAGIAERFVGGHPLGGTHETGFAAARPDRLRGCVVYICDTGAPTADRAARYVAGFWERVIGATPIFIDADAHDRQLAWTSHLPQVVASTLARSLAGQGLSGVSFGSGARDTTRLASSNPDMWVEILMLNREAVAESVAGMEQHLRELRDLLERGDAAGLEAFLNAGRRFRQGIER